MEAGGVYSCGTTLLLLQLVSVLLQQILGGGGGGETECHSDWQSSNALSPES